MSPQREDRKRERAFEFVGMGLNIFVVAAVAAAAAALVVWSGGGVEAKVAQKAGCDMFNGDWVMDNSSSYPYYESSQCPFFEDQFNCRKNGRSDNDYTNYYWRPADRCLLPRFNGVEFMRKIKGKQVMFVGDSLSLNQWQSLTCLLHVAVPNSKYISKTEHGLSTFSIPDYNVSIMFFRNAFLVDITNETRGRVLRLDSISSSKIWGGMDYVIFDTWHWWNNTGAKQPWDWVVYGNTRVLGVGIPLLIQRGYNVVHELIPNSQVVSMLDGQTAAQDLLSDLGFSSGDPKCKVIRNHLWQSNGASQSLTISSGAYFDILSNIDREENDLVLTIDRNQLH